MSTQSSSHTATTAKVRPYLKTRMAGPVVTNISLVAPFPRNRKRLSSPQTHTCTLHTCMGASVFLWGSVKCYLPPHLGPNSNDLSVNLGCSTILKVIFTIIVFPFTYYLFIFNLLGRVIRLTLHLTSTHTSLASDLIFRMLTSSLLPWLASLHLSLKCGCSLEICSQLHFLCSLLNS